MLTAAERILLGDQGLDITQHDRQAIAVAFDNNGIPQKGISAFTPQTTNVSINLADT